MGSSGCHAFQPVKCCYRCYSPIRWPKKHDVLNYPFLLCSSVYGVCCKPEIAWPLMTLINQSFESGIFLNVLQIAKVTPLYKKNETYLFYNYRPVSVLSSVSKVYERIMHDQIYCHFNNLDLFYNNQYGLRANHSTAYAILELTDKIINEIDKNNIPYQCFYRLIKGL